MELYIYIAQIIVSIALIVAVVVQSRGGGLGGMMGGGGDQGAMFRTRRGLEKLLFNVTIGLSVIFFALAILIVFVVG